MAATAPNWLVGGSRAMADLCSAAIALFILYTVGIARLPTDFQNIVVLSLALVAVVVGQRWPTGGRLRLLTEVAIRLLLIAGALWSGWYFMENYRAIATLRAGLPNTADLTAYAIGLIVIIEAARRAEGLLFQAVVIVFALYLVFGHHIPGILGHRRLWLEEVLEIGYSSQGVFGVALTSVVNVVYIFIILGVALRITGAGEFFNFIAERLTRGRRSGPAQCAVIASALFGSINGSAPANVASTGVLTIPMMKRAGYPAPFAAGVEASASCVGQLLPPVMGVGAFIMAEITGVPYVEIMFAALIPALLFIGSLMVAVALEARRLGMAALPSDPEPWSLKRAMQGTALAAGFTVLLSMLFSGFSATYSGLGATVAVLAVALLAAPIRPERRAWLRLVVEGGRDGLALTVACAAIGIVIAGVAATGLGIKMNQAIVALGGDTLLLALLLAALCSIIIGMGLPTAAAYLMVVFIAGPALMRLGVELLQAHMFVFYYAVLSAITPPVALALFAASAIAGVSPLVAAVPVMRLAFVGFLLPVAWVYHPALMLGSAPSGETLLTLAAFAVAITAATAGFVGMLRQPLGLVERAALLGAAGLMVAPALWTTLAGLALAGLVGLRHWLVARPRLLEERISR